MARKWYELPAVCLLFLVLGIVSTYPMVLHFDTGIPYSIFGGDEVWNRSGDQIQLMYWFWLVKENFLGAVPFDSNPFEFNMGIPYDTSGLNTIPLAFIYMLFSPLGDVAAYNSTILTSYVLTGLFTYLLVRLYSGSRAGALLAAVVLTLAPSRIRGLTAGHGYGFLFFCYPFILYFLEKGVRAKKIVFGVIWGLVSAVGLAGLAILEPHLIYYICIFLTLYIPLRVVSLFELPGKTGRKIDLAMPAWPAVKAVTTIWGAGAALTVFAQVFFLCREKTPFPVEEFWWAFGVYPFVLLLLTLCLTAIYQRLTSLDFEQSLTVEAKSLLPLYLSLPLTAVVFLRPFETGGGFVLGFLLTVTALKIWFLRRYLLPALGNLAVGLWRQRQAVVAMLPLVLTMAGIVYWMASSKVERVASTVAGGGRTLDDVALFSADFSDLFLATSNVYIGIIPALLAGGLLVAMLAAVIGGGSKYRFDEPRRFLRLFFLTIVLCCLVLSLGLAFGDISLYALLFHYFPFFNYPRVSDRIITVALFALAILVGFVVAAIERRYEDRRASLGLISVVTLLAAGYQLYDYNIHKPMGINMLDRGQDIYTYVGEHIGDGNLLEIPLWPGDSHQSSLYQHYIMLDRIPRINGSSPMVLKKYVEEVFKPLASINRGELDRKQFERLHEMKVKFITVHDNRDVFLKKVSPFVPLTTVRRLQNSPFVEQVEIDNYMHFKNDKGRNIRLYLFRLRDRDEVAENKEKAWYEMPYYYDVDWRLHTQTGSVVEDETLQRRVFEAREGRNAKGFLVYGPYDVYSPGSYRCYFSLRASDGEGRPLVRLEAARVDEEGEVTALAQKHISSGTGGRYVKDYVDFTISEETKLEFRVFYYGFGTAAVEKVVINRAGNDKPLQLIEAEKMVGDTGLLERRADASTGKVVAAKVSLSPKGRLVYGPDRLYGKGRYTALFRLGRGGREVEPEAVVGAVAVTDGQQRRTFVRRNMRAADLAADGYTTISVDFELEREEFLSFQVDYTRKTDMMLDVIEVLPRE